jgi:hypothetical protein
MEKKVCIVGFAPSYKEAPWGNQEYEFWCLNEFYKLAKGIPNFSVARWFEIHDRNSPSKATPEHAAFLKQCPVPVYMWTHYDDIPNSIRFPKDEVLAWFEGRGFNGSAYFNNSISWMIALAMMEGYKHIAVYGVDMSTSSEYGHQKPSCEYILGLAEGMGIKIELPESSELLKCGQLYGFESNNRIRAWMKAQAKEMDKRIAGLEQQLILLEKQREKIHEAISQCQGAKSAYAEILKRSQ